MGMNNEMNEEKLISKRIWRVARYVVPLLFLAVAIILPIIASERAKGGVADDETAVNDAAAIEALYGIRVKRVNLLAGGGAVEFRFIVTDPDKANVYMHDPEYMPVLIAEDSGVRIEAPQTLHGNLIFRVGSGYPRMYSNPGGVIVSGRPITIEFGEYRLENFIVQ